ncbi:cupin domain-containing protein [Tenacibaculum finnmarkense]|uniref:Cupin n=1 Tax=Tenacibaculum finnmarkense genomovar finnmarkense TaxID=1458503 RepID=A0AAP1WFQ3_9FLAO|nr:AraC family ligand binding domain-containing protein [Tenacibaculum finnmarkense]MBE7652274.1 cupin [Tenacibaculum finnmarkense genomovar finnmarkense]MBE7694554.1 cupin [Tenacibaculum finnmarkense genomovar finnmarkense]MCD8426741.1 AraC family ligand binding domain-containing protein [Tenacibaculum finnmarkense genomovar finnmarkense]MCG8730527.1 cupin domain-containing protein [Tenacibaculum finnmarkense]MCG8750966.1 cupin domain-containing protein [Tenacibaculum finnmarkense]
MKVASFLEDIKFNENKPAVSLLLDTGFSKEIRIVFKKGQVMEAHQAPFAIIVQVIKGCIDFGVDNEIKQLNAGDIISLKPQVVHDLTAVGESVVRLSLSKTDTVKRVENV